MKEYVVTKSELTELGALGIGASLFFTLCASLLGFAIDVSKDIAFANGTASSVIQFWSAMRASAAVGALVTGLIGVALVAYGSFRLRQILSETDHGGS